MQSLSPLHLTSTVVLPALLLMGCGPGEDEDFYECDTEYVPGIRIGASDARTGLPVDSLSGYVRDGAYVDSIQQAWTGPAEAAGERPGTYEVHLRAPGYVAWDTTGVVATANGCHVGTAELNVHLTPLGSRTSGGARRK